MLPLLISVSYSDTSIVLLLRVSRHPDLEGQLLRGGDISDVEFGIN